ncbi:MAG: hypothetical protein MJ158_02945, partial [Alphaproteobacteria bacterium]|nr:hypothetical protein [Alphaproteobacteria bacterium]
TFIEHVCEIWPDRVIQIKDKFFDITNPRGYRDAKIILNIGTVDNIIPMEIICQVRTFFEFERQTHKSYEKTRRNQSAKAEEVEKTLADFMEQGIQEYNSMIADCLSDLFDRIGWNILYSNGDNSLLFDGFPKISSIYYPNKIKDIILTKVDTAVENEVFVMPNAPIPLTQDQKMRIFRWLAKFILVTAMPYSNSNWSINTEKMPGKFFNFIMKELQRYYKKS